MTVRGSPASYNSQSRSVDTPRTEGRPKRMSGSMTTDEARPAGQSRQAASLRVELDLAEESLRLVGEKNRLPRRDDDRERLREVVLALQHQHEIASVHKRPGRCKGVQSLILVAKRSNHGTQPLQRYTLAPVLAQIAEFDELPPGDDAVTCVFRAYHWLVEGATPLVPIKPGAHAANAETEQASRLADSVEGPLKNRNRGTRQTAPSGCETLGAVHRVHRRLQRPEPRTSMGMRCRESSGAELRQALSASLLGTSPTVTK